MFKKYIFILVFVFSIQYGFSLKPDSTYYWKPSIFGLIYKEHKVITKDNFELNMWFFPSQQELSKDSLRYYYSKRNIQRPYVTDSVKKSTIIVCNGDAGNMSQLLSFAYIYIRQMDLM